jgi:prevent-host-death family protein
MFDITRDIQSLTNFRRKSGQLLKQIKKRKRPVVLTVNRKAEAVVQDAEAYQRLLELRPARMCTKRSGKARTTSLTAGCVPPAKYSTRCAGAMAYLVELTLRARQDLTTSTNAFRQTTVERRVAQAAPPSKHRAKAVVPAGKPRELIEIRVEIESPHQFVLENFQVARADASVVEYHHAQPWLRGRSDIVDSHAV